MSTIPNAISANQPNPQTIPGVCRVLGCNGDVESDETICPDCFSEQADRLAHEICRHVSKSGLKGPRLAVLRYRMARDKDLPWYGEQMHGAPHLTALEANHLREVTCAAAARLDAPPQPLRFPSAQRIDLGVAPAPRSTRLPWAMLTVMVLALLGWFVLVAHWHITVVRPVTPPPDNQVICATE